MAERLDESFTYVVAKGLVRRRKPLTQAEIRQRKLAALSSARRRRKASGRILTAAERAASGKGPNTPTMRRIRAVNRRNALAERLKRGDYTGDLGEQKRFTDSVAHDRRAYTVEDTIERRKPRIRR